MPHPEAVVFDLFETLVTEFDPDWRPGPSPGDRLGLPDRIWTSVWRSRHAERMTSVVDFRGVLREACTVAGTGWRATGLGPSLSKRSSSAMEAAMNPPVPGSSTVAREGFAVLLRPDELPTHLLDHQ